MILQSSSSSWGNLNNFVLFWNLSSLSSSTSRVKKAKKKFRASMDVCLCVLFLVSFCYQNWNIFLRKTITINEAPSDVWNQKLDNFRMFFPFKIKYEQKFFNKKKCLCKSVHLVGRNFLFSNKGNWIIKKKLVKKQRCVCVCLCSCVG